MLVICLLIGSLTVCFAVVAAAKPLPAERPEMSAEWRVVPGVGTNPEPPYVYEIVLTNNGTRKLSSNGWRLFFNSCRQIEPSKENSDIRFVHVNGDLFYLEPTPAFAPFRRGTERTIRFQTQLPLIKATDGPSGLFLVVEDARCRAPEVIPLGDPNFGGVPTNRQSRRSRDDLVPVATARSRYEENLALAPRASQQRTIVPTPITLTPGAGETKIRRNSVIVTESAELRREAAYLANSFEPLLGTKLHIAPAQASLPGNAILLRLGTVTINGQEHVAGENAYQLSVADGGNIAIQGTDPSGVFYGVQTLRALIPVESYRDVQDAIPVAAVEVLDAPQFKYRGMHLDVARNFQNEDTVKKLLELMAFYKLNKLHFHLTDDEGWRLEIEGLPELTEVGGKRLFSVDGKDGLPPSFGSGPIAEATRSHGTGFYTRQRFIDILRFATERHIEVIPEIDLPGHSRAAILAMEARYQRLMAEGLNDQAGEFLLHDPADTSQYESVQLWNDNVVNPCQESTNAFVMHVLNDVKRMYHEAGLELKTIHLGGDEVPAGVWEGSSACSAEDGKTISRNEIMTQFFRKIAESFTREHGIILGAWEEVFLNELRKSQLLTDSAQDGFTGSDYLCYVWNNVWGWGQEDVAYRLANSGVNVVLCNATHLYFDLAYNNAPWEPGYYWAGFVDTKTPYSFAPLNYLSKTRQDIYGRDISEDSIKRRVRLTEDGKKHVVGVQGQLWGENLKGEGRLEYMALPRLIALAERAWAKEPAWIADENLDTWPQKLRQAWSEFATQLGTVELPRLDFLAGGFHYRIPEPGAVIEEGLLMANCELPGMVIRYTTDGSEPDARSQVYTQPAYVGTTARVRVFTSHGRGGRSSLVHDEFANRN